MASFLRRAGLPFAAAGLLLLLAGLVGLAGCGGKKQDAKVIRVTRNLGGKKAVIDHWNAWKAAFERKNPPWKMELIDLGNQDAPEFYKSRIATGDLPDVIQTWTLTNFLADGGHLVPMSDSYYEKFGIPLPVGYKGKRYASMGGVQIQGIAVNRTMWADIGVTQPPATWAEFIAGLRKLKDKGHAPLVYGAAEWSAHMPLMCSLQVNLYDSKADPARPSWTKLRDQGKVKFATDPTARRVMESMIELMTLADKGAPSNGYDEEQKHFYGGEGAAWIMGCWLGGNLETYQTRFDVEYWPFPPLSADRKPTFVCVSGMQSGWAVTTSATGEKLPKAIACMEALYDPEVYQLFLNGEAQLVMATRVGVKGPQSSWPAEQKFFDNMAANYARYGQTPGYCIALDDQPPANLERSMERVMQEILAGTRDVDQLLKMLDDDWDAGRKGM